MLIIDFEVSIEAEGAGDLDQASFSSHLADWHYGSGKLKIEQFAVAPNDSRGTVEAKVRFIVGVGQTAYGELPEFVGAKDLPGKLAADLYDHLCGWPGNSMGNLDVLSERCREVPENFLDGPSTGELARHPRSAPG